MDETPATPVTALLREWRDGDPAALDRLTPLVYDELRRLARLQMRRERGEHTLQPTALVHEAYERLIDAKLPWQDRTHFLSVAARIMRRVLVDHARARHAAKRGGEQLAVTLTESTPGEDGTSLQVIALHQALEKLAKLDSREAQAIELHYFGGLTFREIAAVLEVSRNTVERDIQHARAWLQRELT